MSSGDHDGNPLVLSLNVLNEEFLENIDIS